MRARLVPLLFALALPGCASDSRCNGALALCDRRFDQVVYPTTHNAMADTDDGYAAPDQTHPIARQLQDGVRALMLDLHYDDGQTSGPIYLCHALCSLGSRPLVDGLIDIRRFLDDHPREVVTLILESYVTAADAVTVFDEANLTHYAFVPSGGAFPRENPWDNQTPADFSCGVNRGAPSNPLFVLNHFLDHAVNTTANAQQVNFDPELLDEARRCQMETGRLPNFVTVDFYEIGDLFAAVDALNGVTPPPGSGMNPP